MTFLWWKYREQWWSLSDTRQRFNVIFGTMAMFAILNMLYPLLPFMVVPYYFLFMLCVGALATIIIVYGVEKWCLNPYENVMLEMQEYSTGSMGSSLVKITNMTKVLTIRQVNNAIKDLFKCFDTDFWTRLAKEDFPRYDVLVYAECRVPSGNAIMGNWTLTETWLAYEDYLRRVERYEFDHVQFDSFDMSLREAFETNIAEYFNQLPAGYRELVLNDLAHYDHVPDGIWGALGELPYGDLH